MVIDRFQLYLFLAVTIGGTIGILINAPHIFEYVDQDAVKAKIMGTSPTEWIPDGDTCCFMTSSLQLFLVTWCCCLIATKDDVTLLFVFGTGNDVVTNPNRRISCTLKLHFFSCTLPKSYEHTGCCWISFYAPEGRRMLDDLGEHQRSLCLEEVAKEHERCLLVYFREIGADLKLKVSHENLLL